MKKVTHISEIKVGDRIKILARPNTWGSFLNDNYPLNQDFPLEVTVKEIKHVDVDRNHSYMAMTCGYYGWSLNSIVEAGCEIVNSTSLPENWYIKGGYDLQKLLLELEADLQGNMVSTAYFQMSSKKRWGCYQLDSPKIQDYVQISVAQYREHFLNEQTNQNNQTILNSEGMQTTEKPKDRIVVIINKNNEIETSKNGITTKKVLIWKETITTRTLKINGVERDLSVSVIVDEDWNIHAGYSIRNPKWDKENNPELAKTVARNRAVNPKTNLLKSESISIGIISKYVLKGIAEQIFANVSKGIIQIKGVK